MNLISILLYSHGAYEVRNRYQEHPSVPYVFIVIHNLNDSKAWHDFTMISNRGVLDITQCTSFSGQTGHCNTSTMAISNLNFGNTYGTVVAGVSRLGTFTCSAAAPCHNITIGNMDVQTVGSGTHVSGYSCTAVQGTKGFAC
jgi:galacturan 1,4-alpha-galacturonidase